MTLSFDEFNTEISLDFNDFQRKNLINKTLYWSGSDREDHFKSRIKKEGMQSNTIKYYIDNPITYQYNNFGYRTYDDFNKNDDGIVTLGCSYTEGIGLHLEHTWGYRIAKKLNKKFWNLGEGGFGLDKCYYNLLFFIDYLKFDDIFLLIPPKFRFCFYTRDNTFLKGHNNTWISKSIHDWFDNKQTNELFFNSETTEFLRQLSYLHAIKYLAGKKNKQLYVLDCTYDIGNDEYDEYNFGARDIHFSPNHQFGLYLKFMEKYYNTK